jgi:hypothetical protein
VVVRGRGLETLGSLGLTVFGVVSEDLMLRVSWVASEVALARDLARVRLRLDG